MLLIICRPNRKCVVYEISHCAMLFYQTCVRTNGWWRRGQNKLTLPREKDDLFHRFGGLNPSYCLHQQQQRTLLHKKRMRNAWIIWFIKAFGGCMGSVRHFCTRAVTILCLNSVQRGRQKSHIKKNGKRRRTQSFQVAEGDQSWRFFAASPLFIHGDATNKSNHRFDRHQLTGRLEFWHSNSQSTYCDLDMLKLA